jgi:hypothetical protein
MLGCTRLPHSKHRCPPITPFSVVCFSFRSSIVSALPKKLGVLLWSRKKKGGRKNVAPIKKWRIKMSHLPTMKCRYICGQQRYICGQHKFCHYGNSLGCSSAAALLTLHASMCVGFRVVSSFSTLYSCKCIYFGSTSYIICALIALHIVLNQCTL